jgi:hypothetical protein
VPGTGDTIVFDGTGKKNAIIATSAFLYPLGELRMGTSNTGTIMMSSPLMVLHNLSLSGGMISMSGGSLITVKGSWQNGGGTLNAGTGTVILGGTGSVSYTLAEPSAFKNLSLGDGLVGNWKLDEGTGSTTTSDSSPNARTGTLVNGPTWSTNVPTDISFGDPKSLHFDGTNDYVSFDNTQTLLKNATTGTISVWVNPDTIGGGTYFGEFRNVIFGQATGASFDNAVAVAPATNNIRFLLGGGSAHSLTSNALLSTGVWTHIVATWGPSGMALYVNGRLDNSNSTVGIWSTSLVNYNELIGRIDTTSFGLSSSFKGFIDDVRIYNRALSAAEVASLTVSNTSTSSGTYVLGSALTLNGTLGVYNGTLDVSSSSFAVTTSGSFIANGTFLPHNDTLTVNGVGGALKLNGTTLYNLVVNAAKSTILRAAATVTNALTINAGATLTLSGNTLTALTTAITNQGTIVAVGTGAIKHTSSFSISPSTATLGSPLTLTVTDSNRNVNGAALDSLNVSDGQESVTLHETGNATGIFSGPLPTAYGSPAANTGTFEFDPGSGCTGSASFTYTDSQDSSDVSSATVTLNAPSTCTAPTPTSGTTDSSSGGGGGGGGGGRSVSFTPTTATPFSNTTTTTATVTSTPFVSTGNVLIDGAIKRLDARIEKMLAKNPNSVFAKSIQRRIAKLIARVKH